MPAPGEAFAIVAIASSAGGITALGHVLAGLPADFPVPVLAVQHLDTHRETTIATILGRRTRLRVLLAEHGQRAKPGTVYVAPPNHHLLVDASGRLTLSRSGLVHFVRPSADVLFESVADAYGPAAIACVLTGAGVDGAKGAAAVQASGGTVVVQDPETAAFPGMPGATLAACPVDLVVSLAEIPETIRALVGTRRHARG